MISNSDYLDPEPADTLRFACTHCGAPAEQPCGQTCPCLNTDEVTQ